MKKLLFILTLIIFISCNKNDDDLQPTKVNCYECMVIFTDESQGIVNQITFEERCNQTPQNILDYENTSYSRVMDGVPPQPPYFTSKTVECDRK